MPTEGEVMAFIDVKNKNGEIQTVPDHYLELFPDQFKPVDPEKSAAKSAAQKKES